MGLSWYLNRTAFLPKRGYKLFVIFSETSLVAYGLYYIYYVLVRYCKIHTWFEVYTALISWLLHGFKYVIVKPCWLHEYVLVSCASERTITTLLMEGCSWTGRYNVNIPPLLVLTTTSVLTPKNRWITYKNLLLRCRFRPEGMCVYRGSF